MGRVNKDSLLWILCCCGCLPIIGLIQGIIIFVPITLMLLLSCPLISFVFLPPTVVMGFYTYVSTPRLGPKIKILGCLLVPIPLILWPALVIVISLFAGIGLGLFSPMLLAFDEKYELFCGTIIHVFKAACDWIQEFYEFSKDSVFNEFRSYREPYEGQPWDISLGTLFISVFMAFAGLVIDGVVISLTGVALFIPCFLRMYYEYIKLYLCGKGNGLEAIMYFLPWVIGLALVPVAAVLGLAIVIIGGFLYGMYAAVENYQKGAGAGFEFISKGISEFCNISFNFASKGTL